MDAADAWLAGPWGSSVAIAAMAVATAFCRVAGYLVMSRIRLTPRVQAALAALPGSIVAATVVPIAIRSGPAGIAGVVTAIVVTRLARNELVALGSGLAVAAGVRALWG